MRACAAEELSKRITLRSPWNRARNYYRRNATRFLFTRPLSIHVQVPIISFTFDDFPRSALLTGGAILNQWGAVGTYYAAMGLIGQDSVSGPIFEAQDLSTLLGQGHELGCHTYFHSHSWNTDGQAFETSILENRKALQKLVPGAEFKSLSYPISEPRPMVKRRAVKYFECCRAGGQALNVGTVDLNQLSAFFLEKTRDDIRPVKEIIDRNRESRGWLILATHDVVHEPSPYGCTPEFFAEVVKYAANSGAQVLPVMKALEAIRGGGAAPGLGQAVSRTSVG